MMNKQSEDGLGSRTVMGQVTNKQDAKGRWHRDYRCRRENQGVLGSPIFTGYSIQKQGDSLPRPDSHFHRSKMELWKTSQNTEIYSLLESPDSCESNGSICVSRCAL